ncbi:MAG: hypothetical protein M1343_06780 [Chloroflexi bacterium]|nr:hypothetical protein [Chloroflexota bacterium]MDA8187783.1 hypothetical protein [Dehalococcoidales bacterium]
MHAQVTFFKIKPGTIEEMRTLTEERIAPWLRGRRGFHGLHVMSIGATDVYAFGVWLSKADADASKPEYDRLMQQILGHLLTATPEHKEGNVILHVASHEPHLHR